MRKPLSKNPIDITGDLDPFNFHRWHSVSVVVFHWLEGSISSDDARSICDAGLRFELPGWRASARKRSRVMTWSRARRFFETMDRSATVLTSWLEDLGLTRDDLDVDVIPAATFWIWDRELDQWRGVRLEYGEQIEMEYHSSDVEGSASQWTCYRHEGDRVTFEWSNRSSDCDGAYSASSSGYALISELAAMQAYQAPDVMIPDWIPGNYSQRDHSAERSGY